MEYNGERFLDVLYTQLYKSEEVEHTKEKSDTKEESIKRYMDRLESIHNKANTQNKKDLVKHLYFDKYVIKEENLPKNLNANDKEGIIESQKKTLSTWIDYLTDENAMYPMWAKYWVFQQMIKMGTYDEVNGKYTKRTKNTINPFVEANPEVIAKCIGNLTNLLGDKKLSAQQIKKLVSNISFEKMYIEYQKNIKKQYKSNEGIWIKYREGSVEDAKKLSAFLEGKNTGWCTANESTAIYQLCGGSGYHGGDFYVYYTKDENNEYKVPRIAIRLNGHHNIGEIRGVAEHQNLEEEMIPILESKLKKMPFINKTCVAKNLEIVNRLKQLVVIKKKTIKSMELTEEEIINLYTENFGFGWQQDPLVEKITQKRDIIDDYSLLKKVDEKIKFLTKNISYIEKLKFQKFIKEKEVILNLINNVEYCLPYASEELQNDKEVVICQIKRILTTKMSLLNLIPNKYYEDKYIVLNVIKGNNYIEKFLEHVNFALRDDKDIILEAVKSNGYALEYASDRLKNDKNIVLEAVKTNGYALAYASDRLKNDKEIVIKAISKRASALEYVSEELRNDKEIVLIAFKKVPDSLKYMGEKLKNDEEFMLYVVNTFPSFLGYFSVELKNNYSSMLKAIKINYNVFAFIGSELRMDKKFLKDAVKINAKILIYNYEDIADREIMDEIFKQNLSLTKYVDFNSIKDDKYIFEKIKMYPRLFRYLPDSLAKNKKFVLAGIKKNPYAGLHYIIGRIKSTKTK